jgi:hypothetical protein
LCTEPVIADQKLFCIASAGGVERAWVFPLDGELTAVAAASQNGVQTLQLLTQPIHVVVSAANAWEDPLSGQKHYVNQPVAGSTLTVETVGGIQQQYTLDGNQSARVDAACVGSWPELSIVPNPDGFWANPYLYRGPLTLGTNTISFDVSQPF